MVKKYFLILLFFNSLNQLHSQHINLSEEEVIATLCHTWSLSFASIQGKPIQINIDLKVQFNPDNSYFLLSNPQKIGKWRYNQKGKFIELTTNDRTARITTLNKKEMVFIEMQVDEHQRVTPQKSQFHFIRE
ncbi:hypothetical protein [Flavobacterium sp. 9AF]|uniref:hypothetical protein n=1 Tax=Flavobacterium sp. 9AF TaxID=2653142 RepID=UPI001359A814|nr:hypothetical protein [Flavobacterium sp. 9AF]